VIALHTATHPQYLPGEKRLCRVFVQRVPSGALKVSRLRPQLAVASNSH
jgi:hypothetical protein